MTPEVLEFTADLEGYLLRIFSTRDGGNKWHRGWYQSPYPDTLLPKQPCLAPECPASRSGPDFQRSLLRAPVGRLGREQQEEGPGPIFISPSLPRPSYPG